MALFSSVAARAVLGLVATLAVPALGAGSEHTGFGADIRAAPSVLQPPASTRTAVRVPRRPRYRFIYNSGSVPATVASYGWNLLDVGSKSAADLLPPRTRGLVWLGDYDNSTCAWELSDSALRHEIGTPGDPKVAGYFISDEPNPYACPSGPAQHKARSDLIHSIDPTKPTVIVLDSNGFTGMGSRDAIDQIPLWKGTATYIGLDPYVCYTWSTTCDYARIDANIRAADAAGINYWGVVQAFSDGNWRWPTAAELQHILKQWGRSRQTGYMTFAWHWAGRSLSSQRSLLAVFRRFNRGTTRRSLAIRRRSIANGVDEIHYTFTGATAVSFDWRGTATTIRYGRTSRYGRTGRAHRATPAPFSSSGPFWEASLGRLKRGTTYHYSIGGSADQTFATAPTKAFRFDVEADVGDSGSAPQVRATQEQIATDKPAFVIVAGDITYGNNNGQAAVDRHFDDVMAWSRHAAYMPAWGNHEWDSSSDDLRNYKGRFAIPHAQTSPGAPSQGCCGEDWGWFDAGGIRFISYPEPYARATWVDWQSKAERLMASAQANPHIHFIVTFGHRPAYSSGYHSGEPALASILDGFGDRYSKYVLNLNGHSHNYERFAPIHRIVHLTAAGGGAPLEPWRSKDTRTAYRALHLEHVRVNVTATRIQIQALCGPATSADGSACRVGEPIDSYTIRRPGVG